MGETVIIATEHGGLYILTVPCLSGLSPDAPWASLRADAHNTGRAAAP